MFTPYLKIRTKEDLIIDLLLDMQCRLARAERAITNEIHEAVKEIVTVSQDPAAQLVLTLGRVVPQ